TCVQPLLSIFDYPQIATADLMLREVSPRAFDFRLVTGSMNGVYNVELAAAPGTRDPDTEPDDLPPEATPRRRQKVHALFDISSSMADDNRAIVGKALLLAYLIMACEERATIFFRTFGNTVHPRTD